MVGWLSECTYSKSTCGANKSTAVLKMMIPGVKYKNGLVAKSHKKSNASLRGSHGRRAPRLLVIYVSVSEENLVETSWPGLTEANIGVGFPSPESASYHDLALQTFLGSRFWFKFLGSSQVKYAQSKARKCFLPRRALQTFLGSSFLVQVKSNTHNPTNSYQDGHCRHF